MELSQPVSDQFASGDPVFQLVRLMLRLLVSEQVDEAVLRPEQDDYRFSISHDGAQRELEPPPREGHHKIVDVLESLFAAAGPDGLRVSIGDAVVQVACTLRASPSGKIVRLRLFENG